MKDNGNKIAALVLGVILFAAGITAAAVSVADHTSALSAVNEFRDSVYVRQNGELVTNYNGYPVIVPGELSYDEGGATDPVFGVNADTVLLVRIAEMYQWLPAKSGFEAGWSEELVDTGDEDHANPDAYPNNVKSGAYSAHSVKLGGFKVSDEQLSVLTAREKLTMLPEVDVRGYRTVGEYITNAENYDSPQIGDMRIRYEYVTACEMTITGMQLDSGTRKWYSEDDHEFDLSFEGKLTKAEVIAGYRRAADPVVWWLLLPGVIAAIGGAVLAMGGFCAVSGYKATVNIPLGKNKLSLNGDRAAAAYAAMLGALALAVTLSAMWTVVAPLWLLFSLVLAVVFLYILIPNIMKNTPKRVKPETPYEPILRRRDEFKKK